MEHIMTFEEFLTVLSTSNNGFSWKPLEQSFAIRAQHAGYTWCPLTVVCYMTTGQRWSPADWPMVTHGLDLTHELARSIVEAADGAPPYDANIREQLLGAVGMASN